MFSVFNRGYGPVKLNQLDVKWNTLKKHGKLKSQFLPVIGGFIEEKFTKWFPELSWEESIDYRVYAGVGAHGSQSEFNIGT